MTENLEVDVRALGRLALPILALVAGCGSKEPTPPDGMNANGGSSDGGVSACASVVREVPPTSTAHVVPCSPVTYDTDPPSGGAHYAVWAAFQSYDFPVPHGFLVHALEHGAVVYWYNCPDGCADEVAQVEGMIEALPADPLCQGRTTPRRVILTPSPSLGRRWAASSWGFTLQADCFEPDPFRDFYTQHFGRGPEALCNPGDVITASTCP
jgi:hypothetical protein